MPRKSKEGERAYNAAYYAAHRKELLEHRMALRAIPEFREKQYSYNREYKAAMRTVPEYREKERAANVLRKAALRTIPEFREREKVWRRAQNARKKQLGFSHEEQKD